MRLSPLLTPALCRSCRRLRSFDFVFKIKRSQPSAAPTRGGMELTARVVFGVQLLQAGALRRCRFAWLKGRCGPAASAPRATHCLCNCYTHMGLTHIIVVRGFIPAGLRSSPKIIQPDPSDKPSKPGLGPLRSPSGINPLTTDKYFKQRGCVSRAGGVWRAALAGGRGRRGCRFVWWRGRCGRAASAPRANPRHG